MTPAVETYQIDEFDRRLSEDEEAQLTNLSRTTRWKLAREGRYPPKGLLGPWLSDVLQFVVDPENYRFPGEGVVSDDVKRPDVRRRRIKRRAVRAA